MWTLLLYIQSVSFQLCRTLDHWNMHWHLHWLSSYAFREHKRAGWHQQKLSHLCVCPVGSTCLVKNWTLFVQTQTLSWWYCLSHIPTVMICNVHLQYWCLDRNLSTREWAARKIHFRLTALPFLPRGISTGSNDSVKFNTVIGVFFVGTNLRFCVVVKLLSSVEVSPNTFHCFKTFWPVVQTA